MAATTYRCHHATRNHAGRYRRGVHPDDPRYKLIGKHVVLPIVGRKIPIVADDYADPEQGSGAVKITPAHDFNDFEVGKQSTAARICLIDAPALTCQTPLLRIWWGVTIGRVWIGLRRARNSRNARCAGAGQQD